MQIQTFVFNALQENTYVLSQDGKALILDPGCYSSSETKELQAWIEEQDLEVVGVLHTHAHVDHVLGSEFCQRTWGCPLYMPELEKENHKSVESYAPAYGFHQYKAAEIDHWILASEKQLSIGPFAFDVYFVPGHSSGHLAYHHLLSQSLFAGDVLFKQSVGRWDLPGGNHYQLMSSIKMLIQSLPSETQVFPGHGPSTQLGFEAMHNPYIRS